MSKVILSKRQSMTITLGFIVGTSPLKLSSSVAALAGPDSWFSALIAALFGLLVVWIDTRLAGLYPEKTLVEAIVLLLGKWVGGFVAVCFIFIALLSGTQVIWYVGDFFTTVFVPEYPPLPINAIFIAITAVALLYGLEAFSRADEIFYLIVFPLFILAMLMLIPNIKGDNLLPILENGIVPVLKGTIPLLDSIILPIIFLNMFFPKNTGNDKEVIKYRLKGYLLGTMSAFLAVLACTLTFGSTVTADLRFPLFASTREISLGVVFSRLEAMFVLIWMITNFVATFFYFYAGVVGLSQLLGLKSYKTLVLPLLLIVFAYSDTIFKNAQYQVEWDTVVWTPVIFTYGLILPVLLLIVSKLKKAGQRKKG